MVVLIDTNVIIDFLIAREPFYNSASVSYTHLKIRCKSIPEIIFLISLIPTWFLLSVDQNLSLIHILPQRKKQTIRQKQQKLLMDMKLP